MDLAGGDAIPMVPESDTLEKMAVDSEGSCDKENAGAGAVVQVQSSGKEMLAAASSQSAVSQSVSGDLRLRPSNTSAPTGASFNNSTKTRGSIASANRQHGGAASTGSGESGRRALLPETSEEAELKRAALIREQMKAMRRRNEVARVRNEAGVRAPAGAGSGGVSALVGVHTHSDKPLTNPTSPNFKTKNLILRPSRRALPQNQRLGRRPTEPEALSAAAAAAPARAEPYVPKLTVPVAFNLHGAGSGLPLKNNTKRKLPMSYAEKVALEAEELRNYKFKALPFNKKAMGMCGDVGVFRKDFQSKPLTVPKEPKFATDARLRGPPAGASNENLLASQGSIGSSSSAAAAKRAQLRGPTQPVSPKLHTKQRSYAHAAPLSTEERDLEEMKAHPVKGDVKVERLKARIAIEEAAALAAKEVVACPMPDMSAAGFRVHSSNKTPDANPNPSSASTFNFKQVVARPMPDMSAAGFRVHASDRPLTETHEFNMPGMDRHFAAEAELAAKIEAETERAAHDAHFRALQLPNTTFVPQEDKRPEARPATRAVEPAFSSEGRMLQRHQWEAEKAARDKEVEDAKQAEAAARAQKDAEELRMLRLKPASEGGFKFVAKPIDLRPAPVAAAPARRALTQPKSPRFATAARATFRNNAGAAADTQS
ncbi:hypothetical protein JKP88DRAFT_244598 [Tribonema minus]|uniref:TPX2 C-terminal domain-containing protein n=1 Tax=Tribonema minus TaxID=303371 RepID=A0A835Z1C2_9STRA|nr:hypothetical protein JKP88DRAFT_244598 [Tribonema minus]